MMATAATYQRSDSMNCAAEAAEELLKLRMNIGSLATTIDTTLHCLEQENKHDDDTKRISIDSNYIVEDENATTDTLSAELLSIGVASDPIFILNLSSSSAASAAQFMLSLRWYDAVVAIMDLCFMC